MTHKTAICLASGPSLTSADIETSRLWRLANPSGLVICTNNTAFSAPWADAMFAMDTPWWRMYGEKIRAEFQGVGYSQNADPVKYGAKQCASRGIGNSGMGAIFLAQELGAQQIILLGYDGMKGAAGESHHHGDHVSGLGNAGSMGKWNGQFSERLGRITAQVINCSRRTAIAAFLRANLETVIEDVDAYFADCNRVQARGLGDMRTADDGPGLPGASTVGDRRRRTGFPAHQLRKAQLVAGNHSPL